ncbi:hypothetical protein PYCCODRAFT_1468162 [Trametes coccinea BRFM310]|uniref:BTB domain-containing protein n=1 Tax=Trametes coccinea (strain BRFM310) TaxID=1353009 RepID=A0A1Y2INP0_TRAC3|nr:hypothetical protein PYCCODRAFT_1468162 [Trametes coccinea BRFM310]
MALTVITDDVALQRDSMFCFFDGNIVLHAQNDVLFRVHRGVLAFHSEFFNAMFDQSFPISHGPDKDRTIDDCPVIPLEDTADDIRQLLLVIYGKNRLKLPEETTFSILAALVRVGHKYGIHGIVSECQPRLLEMVPTSLRGYKQASERRSALKFTPRNAPEALHLFRLIDLGADNPFIIPFMLFLCSQLEESDIRNGLTRADGTPEKLSDADVRRILSMKRELQRRGQDALDTILYFEGPAPGCEMYDEDGNMHYEDGLECDMAYDDFVDRIPKREIDAYTRGDPFGTWVLDKMHALSNREGVCYACLEPHIEGLEKVRQEAWDALPVLAGMTTQ